MPSRGSILLARFFKHPSQKEFAVSVGASPTFINNLCSDSTKPSIAMAVRIREQTGIPVDAWAEEASSESPASTPDPEAA